MTLNSQFRARSAARTRNFPTHHYGGSGFPLPGGKFGTGAHFGHQQVQRRLCLHSAMRKTGMKSSCFPYSLKIHEAKQSRVLREGGSSGAELKPRIFSLN